MADPEEPQLTTLAERIAALNKQKSFDPLVSSVANAAQTPGKRPPPPAPPVRPANAQRRQTVPAVVNASSHEASHGTSATSKAPPPLPPRGTSTSSTNRVTTPTTGNTAPPPLPGRRPMPPTLPTQTPPALPRRTSAQSTYLSVRRDSTSSEISQHSAVSTRSLGGTASSSASYMSVGSATRKMAPATFDPASLPALPPSKRGLEAKAKEAAAKEAAAKEARGNEIRARQAANLQDPRNAISASPSPAPALRPVLPPRTSNSACPSASATTDTDDVKPVARRLPSSTIRGFGSAQAVKPPILPHRGVQRVPSISASDAARGDVPPPVPLSSRPSIADVKAVSARIVAQQSSSASGGDTADPGACWVCRDWSRPDAVAAQFPRQSLPRHDIVGHLARGLCDPFPSYSDKARAIFTWCHHNIAYDTVSFFNNGVRHHSVEETITSGLAVCQGYAEVYMAVAKRAGLECIVVAGHGKGFGHTALRKGERPPPAKPDGHAWNAVRVDGGVWKLVDACWGAGHICSASNTYKKEFSPREFTLSNELFGRRHFPRDPNHQFRADGRAQSWEEYYRGGVDGEPYQWFGTGNHEGLSEESVEPKNKDISVHKEQVVRFQFSKTCEHWTPEKAGLGKPALFLLSIHGRDGRADELIPMDTNGYWHWVDVNAKDLGSPGQAVEIIKLDSMDGGDARGVSAGEFMSKRGRVGMSWSYIAKWNLVS
ncbi:hypothetical protein E4U30_000781 [Claviceps sp. LM220 group G6]|nr:hypothetical protein E4U30_000781 [Claviceps sp. LM220 group G6]